MVALYPLKKKNLSHHSESRELGEALASGIFLGAAFFHMLPESISLFGKIYGPSSYPLPEVLCVSGFLFFLLLERLSLSNLYSSSKNVIPYLLSITLIIHALIEGVALGIGPTFSEAFMIFIAILAHKGSESFALSITLLRHALPLKRIIFIVIFFSLMTPLGIVAGTSINLINSTNQGQLAAAIFNAFAAGSFLYISTLHHIHFHEHTDEPQSLLEFASLVFGVVAMGVVALWT